MGQTRRSWLKFALAAGAAGVGGFPFIRSVRAQSPGFTPFTRPLFIPSVMTPTVLDPQPGIPGVSTVGSAAVYHGIAPEFFPTHDTHAPDWNMSARQDFELSAIEASWEFIPGISTPVFAYQGLSRPFDPGTRTLVGTSALLASFPGPTFIAKVGSGPGSTPFGTPHVVRYRNQLTVESSLHQHGGHAPAHADGYPDFYTLQGMARDHFYPNVGPRRDAAPGFDGFEGPQEHLPTTMWYHDHGMDITGFNVNRGLAGYYYGVDHEEQQRFDAGVLPALFHPDGTLNAESGYGAFDIPLAIKDFRFNADGTLFYDLLDHDGHLGNVYTVNGRVQPYLNVKRRKYRFRILNADNARYLHLRLSSNPGRKRRNGIPFLLIGKDTWQIPIAKEIDSFTACPAERFDVIIDFSRLPANVDRYYLQNVMDQTEGRKPNGIDPDDEHTPLIEFRLEPDDTGLPEVTIAAGDSVRPFQRILPSEIVATRRFEVERRNGAWQINEQYFSPRRSDSVPFRNSAERWIIENGGGGWWHPIHIHLEGFEVQRLNGSSQGIPVWNRGHIEVLNLEGGDEVEIFLKFRDFRGPFVWHCHLIEHEDMRMMAVFDPRDLGEESLNDGVRPHNYSPEAAAQSGMPIECVDAEHLLFDEEQTLASGEEVGPGDVDQLEGEGVGFPSECEDPPGDGDPGEGQIRPEDPIPERQRKD